MKIYRLFTIMYFVMFLFMIAGCSQNQVKTHLGTGAGAVTGYATCRSLLNSNIEHLQVLGWGLVCFIPMI